MKYYGWAPYGNFKESFDSLKDLNIISRKIISIQDLEITLGIVWLSQMRSIGANSLVPRLYVKSSQGMIDTGLFLYKGDNLLGLTAKDVTLLGLEDFGEI